MTLTLDAPKTSCSPIAPAVSPKGAMLLRVLALLDRKSVPYCVLHGYEQYPWRVDGDVDLLVPARYVPGDLARLLHAHQNEIGARIVQWFEDGAHFIVLAGRGDDGSPVLLQLHVATRYEMAGKVFFTADNLLADRRRADADFWVPSAGVEFSCILINKLAKGVLSDDHGRRLSALYARDAAACERHAAKLLGTSGSDLVITAAQFGDWHPVQRALACLREEMLRCGGGACACAGGKLSRIVRKAQRWLRPRNGLHIVFLGPDGVGKSTAIETFQRDLAPAFLHTAYLTFAPGLLPQKFAPPKPGGPHSLPPRGLAGSLLKAAWWSVCYTAGYYATVHPTLARGGMVVNHRYLVDAIVDQKRYRYAGPVALLRWIWAVAPKPDMVVLLDADAAVIQRRKQEVPPEETAAQVQAYRRVIGALPIGKIINAAQPREKVAAHVEWLVLDHLADRTARNLGLTGGAA